MCIEVGGEVQLEVNPTCLVPDDRILDGIDRNDDKMRLLRIDEDGDRISYSSKREDVEKSKEKLKKNVERAREGLSTCLSRYRLVPATEKDVNKEDRLPTCVNNRKHPEKAAVCTTWKEMRRQLERRQAAKRNLHQSATDKISAYRC
eukprot:g43096.t1